MTSWLLARSLRRAPRRLLLGAVGVAFPVAILAATLFFVDGAVRKMTSVALRPVQVEMRGLATTLKTDMTQVARELKPVHGVGHVDRFAAADVVVGAGPARETARLFAVDPGYLRDHPWVRATGGPLAGGALLNPQLRAVAGFPKAKTVAIELPGHGKPVLTLPVRGGVDLREAFTWFQIPYGEVQGDIALVPRAIVVDFASFERSVLPALRAALGTTTAVFNPGLTDLPPATLEAHVTVDRRVYPGDPKRAVAFSNTLRRELERRAPGSIIVADNAVEPLKTASVDATNAKILFLLLGIPGALAAAALGLATESALFEAQRREEALLRLRGATDGQLAGLTGAHAAVAGALGAVVGLAAAVAAIALAEGRAVWDGVPASRLLLSALLAVFAGGMVTAVRLFRLRRLGRGGHVVAERQRLERGWTPAWRRARLDLVAIMVGAGILVVNALAGGLRPTQTEGSTVAASFYLLLGPIALWVGVSLLAVRWVLGLLARRAQPELARPLPSWRAALTRWLGRRPARMAVALVLGTLAVAFGTQVVAFVDTYRSATRADAKAAFGSDLRFRPTTEQPYLLPPRLPDVAATTPIRTVPVRAGSDRKTFLTIDVASYRRGASVAPRMVSGKGLDGLARDPLGIIVDKESASLFAVKPGDTFPVTIFPDDSEKSRKVNYHVVGVFRSFPPTDPVSEMVIGTRGLPPFLLGQPDFSLGRVAPGRNATAVAAELRRAGLERAFKVTTRADQSRFNQPSLTALNLGPLSDIEAVGAALIAAIGVAVLGAFLVLERRREFGILQAVGADSRQILAGPAQEGLITVAGSIAIGVPLGLGLSLLAVRILGLFFTLPPPLLTVPAGALLGLVALMVATSAVALAAALAAVRRVAAANVLREP